MRLKQFKVETTVFPNRGLSYLVTLAYSYTHTSLWMVHIKLIPPTVHRHDEVEFVAI